MRINSDLIFFAQMEYFSLLFGAIVLLLISTSIAPVTEAWPIDSDMPNEVDSRNFLARNWGDSSLPFSISYSDYGRKMYQAQTSTTTHRPKSKSSRRAQRSKIRSAASHAPRSTEKPNSMAMPLIFTSSGWGPNRWILFNFLVRMCFLWLVVIYSDAFN